MSSFTDEWTSENCSTWTGRFNQPEGTQGLYYFPKTGNWWLGTISPPPITKNSLNWTLVGNTSNFGNLDSNPFWIGDFTASGYDEILFYSPGDGHWWLGTFNGMQLNWTLVGNTSGFGNLSKCPFWAGNFTGSGKGEILFFHAGDSHWWLGTFTLPVTSSSLNWTLADTSSFNWVGANPATFRYFVGQFSGASKDELLLYLPDTTNERFTWYLGVFSGAQLSWTLVGDTTNFGNIGSNPFVVGDFTGANTSDMMFYSPGDGNWWLGILNGTQLGWTKAGNTSGFGNISAYRFLVADFAGIGRKSVMFFHSSDQNWWIGTLNGTQLAWALAGNTEFARDPYMPPSESCIDQSDIWMGHFISMKAEDVMFYTIERFGWWVGQFTTPTHITWTEVAITFDGTQ